MSQIDSAYLKELPPSDPYGDEDGFDCDGQPELEITEAERMVQEDGEGVMKLTPEGYVYSDLDEYDRISHVVAPHDPIQFDFALKAQLERMNQLREGLHSVDVSSPTQDIPHHR